MEDAKELMEVEDAEANDEDGADDELEKSQMKALSMSLGSKTFGFSETHLTVSVRRDAPLQVLTVHRGSR